MSDPEKRTWRHRFVQWVANLLLVEIYTFPAVVVIDATKLPTCRQCGGGPRVH